MRREIVRQVFLKELRETLRDRRSLAVMFGIPMLLYPLLTMGMAGLGVSRQRQLAEETVNIAVTRPAAAPHLIEQMRRPESGIQIRTPADPRRALAEGQIDAVVVVPPDAEANALAAREVEIRLRLDRSRTASQFTQRKLERLLDDYEEWVLKERLKARGMPATLLRPLKTVTDDVATGERRLGSVLAGMLPVMLLVTGMLGAFFPAVNATTAERELGTLETLLVTPASKVELLVAKGLLVLLSGLLTAGINLLSMSLVLWRTFSQVAGREQGLALDVGTLALTYLAAVPTLIFSAALVLVVGLFARNYREANSYATPVMMLSMAPMVVSIAEPKATPGLLATPIVNTSIIMRDVLTGHASAGPFLLAFATSCLYAWLVLSVAARLFATEQLVNPAWEPLSLKGLRRGGGPRERRLPAVDEAIALFAVSLLLLLYVSPIWMKHGLLPLVAGIEILLIAAPALLAAWMGRYRWRETFAWRRPTAATMVAAALIGVGVLPWVYVLAYLQGLVWPQDPGQARAMLELFLPSLRERPVLTAVAVGALAGICEELLYRGPVQTALVRRLPTVAALSIGAVLFAAAHMDLQGMLFRTILGYLLGWMVLRSGSIFPAMLTHAVIDSVNFGFQAWRLHGLGTEGYMAWAMKPESDPAFVSQAAIALAAGAVLLAIGWALWRRGTAGPEPALTG
jgi:sodium transport system permease protein